MTDISISILAVCSSTGQATGNFSGILLTLLRLNVTANTSCFVKFDEAFDISSDAGSSQTGSNDNVTVEVSFATIFFNIVFICQLACQSIEHCSNLISITEVDVVVTGCQSNIGAAFSVLNGCIAANEVILYSTLIIMLINNSVMTAVISNIQFNIAILINITAVSSLFATNQIINIRYAVKIIIARLAVSRHMAIIQAIYSGGRFVSPLCAIAKPNINLTCLSFACVINYTLPGRILCYQPDVDTAILIYVRLIGTLGALKRNYVTNKVSSIALYSFQPFVGNGAHILVVVGVTNVDINSAAIACQRIICFLKAAVLFSFIRRCFNFNRLAYQANRCQIVGMYSFCRTVGTYIDSGTAYSDVHITINSDVTTCITYCKGTRLPACTCIVHISRVHRSCATRANVTMNIFSYNTPRIRRIILAHFYIAVNNKLACAACSYTYRSIVRCCSNIQIAVDSSSTAISSEAVYTSPRIPQAIHLIDVQCTLAAICTYVIIDVVIVISLTISGDTVIVFDIKGMVLTFKIISNSICRFIQSHCITIGFYNSLIILDNTSKRIVVFCRPSWRHSKA